MSPEPEEDPAKALDALAGITYKIHRPAANGWRWLVERYRDGKYDEEWSFGSRAAAEKAVESLRRGDGARKGGFDRK